MKKGECVYMVSVELENDEFVLISQLLKESLEGFDEALEVYEDPSSLEQIKKERKEVVQLLEKFSVGL